jgi:hypothetical protein
MTISIQIGNAARERMMVHDDERRTPTLPGQCPFEPGETRLIDVAMVVTRNGGIQPDKAQWTGIKTVIQCAVPTRQIGVVRKRP